MIKAIFLFSGADGMDADFKEVGIDVIFANEIDKILTQTFQTNHPKQDRLEMISIISIILWQSNAT